MTTPCSSVETTIHQSDNVEVSTPLVEDPQPVADIHGPSHSRLTWEIQNFSHLKQKKLTSEIFGAASYKWQLLVFPKGNNANCLSLYIDVADSPDLPFGWNRYAQFSLAVVNQKEDSLTVRKETRIQLNHRERDWGFKFFMPLDELCEPSRGYLVNDTVVIEADVTVHMMVDIWANDLIKNTGYVGLENQGATCSLNSLLQTLYHIPYFRKAVYQIPTEDDIPSQSVALALQILFFKLQHSDTSVGTEDLTKSFGWNRDDSLIQHDVHELNMKFCANLENKMQGTVVEGTMRKLFEGRFLEYVECTDINFKYLQLDVKGCKDIYASFDKYVKVELLEGYNKYCADHYGLQKAEKGVLFIEFPPVLQLQLKRFEFDCFSSRLVKINDFFEFPLQLDLDRDNGKYLSPEADRSVRNLYTLHSVLVHSGDIHGGHYYAFIRPGLASKWYKFNDGQVTEEYMERNVEVLYGGDDDFSESCSSAYMLLYIREGDKDKIICGIDDNEIPEHLRVSLRKEKENKRRYKAQADLFSINKVARDEDLREPIGKESVFDLVDHDKVPSFRIQKHMPFKHFKTSVSSTSLLACCFEDFVILGADSRIHDNDPTQVLEDNYNKHFLLDGGMHMSVCGWKCTWINIVDWLKQSLPQIQNEDDKKAYTVYCVQYYSCYYVDMTGEPLMPVDAIVGGFWTDPTKLELFHVTRYGHWVDLPVCVGGSGKIFMQDAHSFLKTVPENQILNAMKELLSDAIDNDPGSGGYIQFIMIRSNGEITPITYEPDNFTSPNYYTRV